MSLLARISLPPQRNTQHAHKTHVVEYSTMPPVGASPTYLLDTGQPLTSAAKAAPLSMAA